MTKKNWFKHKESGEVFYREGYTRANAVVVRDRDRKLKWVSMTDFRNWYTPADVSGFPSLKPKGEKPPFSLDKVYRSERGEFWLHEHGDCFVFRQHGSTAREIRPIESVRDLYDRGTLHEVPINKAVEPKKKEFVNGLTYRSAIDGSFYEPVKAHGGVYLRRGFWNTYVGLWEMQFLFDHGQIVLPEDYQPKQPSQGSCQGYGGSLTMAVPAGLGKAGTQHNETAKPKKKILVEWLIRVKAYNGKDWYTRFYPEGTAPTSEYKGQKPFKTGRTIEVDG